MTQQTIHERVEHLEAGAYRQQAINDQVKAGLDHLTSAVGDLSQAQRSMQLDITEIKTELVGISSRLAEQGETLRQQGETLRQQGETLRQILGLLTDQKA